MSAFEYTTTPSIICGPGSIRNAGALVRNRLAAKRVLVVSDPGLEACGLLQRLLDSLADAGLNSQIFLEISSDPLEEEILAGAAAAKKFKADTVVGFGGGSPMDAAKAIAIMATSRKPISELYGFGRVEDRRLPLLLVPTTGGTGSEASPFAVITTPSGEKISITDRKTFPDMALLDAELTLGLPRKLTAACGVDAIVHAIEAYTSKGNKTVLTDMVATRALTLLMGALPLVLEDPLNIQAREDMLIGAMLAGQAISTALVGGIHALAYPLGGLHHIHHGLANSLLLPPVMRFNVKAAADLYAELADATLPGLKGSDEDKTEALIGAIEDMIAAGGLETRLTQVGLNHNHIPKLAEEAMKIERLLVNNPVEITSDDCLKIYESIL